jgi:hypothetical protein
VEEWLEAFGPRELALPVVALGMVVWGTITDSAVVSVALVVIGAGMFFIGMLLPSLTEFQIGTSGFSGKLRDRDWEIRSTLDPDSGSLLQLAIQLAGSEANGKELLERALVETYVRWSQAQREGPADAVRQHLQELAPLAEQAPPVGPGGQL